ncbi:MAG: hypothetical protein AAF609_07585 [Cyanobacteria bacterium P01_C01_bin.120]
MSVKNIGYQLAGVTAGVAIVVGSATTALAQNATEDSMYQAGYNAGVRLQSAGYDLNNLEGAPYYTAFLENGDVQTVSVNIPYTGEYVLLIGGDDDTMDLDVYFPQIGAQDVTYGPTGLIEFSVTQPGEFVYEIDMLECQTVNCGVYAVLLTVDN